MPHLSVTSRRRFLERVSGVAAGGVAAPYVITSSALGNATTPPASDRIVTAGIGIGNAGSGDKTSFSGGGLQYVAVCDVQEKKREAAKGGNPNIATYVDFRELLARDDIDVVHIATPDHWHALMTIAACRSGKDVFVQKPESLTLREGALMVAAARRYGRVVSGGSQRVMADYRGIVDPLWAGELGVATTIDVQLGESSGLPSRGPLEAPPDIDWELFLGPAPWSPFGTGFRGNYDFSGGKLTDWGAHILGGALFAADLREQQPTKLTFHTGAAGMSWISLTYPGGVEIFINRDKTMRPVPSIGDASGPIQVVTDGRPRPPRPVPQYKGGHNSPQGDFIECVKTRERPFRDIELAVNTMAAIHMIGIGRQLQRSLSWDRATQSFVGDAEANRLLDRARREPWVL